MLQIENIELLWFDDEDEPNATERLGTYSPIQARGAIDRTDDPSYQPTEYRFWIPAKYEPEHPENAKQDYLRHESLCRGEWRYQHCVAQAIVSYKIGDVIRLETLSSGGMGGIESDCSPLSMLEFEIEQIEDLKNHVQVFGVPWTETQETFLMEARNRLVVLKARRDDDSQFIRNVLSHPKAD